MSKQIISRADTSYKEIEKFKDYELTQCIAYEMAIRNPERKKLYQEYKKYVYTDKLDKWVSKFNTVQTYEEYKKLITDFIEAEGISKETVEKNEKLFKIIEEKTFFQPQDNIKLPDFTNNTINSYLDRTSQREQVSKLTCIDSNTIKQSIFQDTGIVKTIHNATLNYEKLFPKFSRPLPVIPKTATKEIDIHINLQLPEKELLSYLETIKKNYDKSHGEALRPSTPLSMAIDIDKEIFTIQIKMKKKGSQTNLEMPEKTQQEVYADLLFLYDVFTLTDIKKQSDKITFFRNNMIDYYAMKVCKYHGIKDIDEVSDFIGTPRDQTVREYVKMMQAYIDDYGYKKLLV